ncbi:MAG TPA: ribosome maturation factor RimP [Candidatus Agathobaculum merdipullorum]|nr:ribosome maturation factor RimP [uncultured Agathobaculum sp.]HIY12967.1 ribosome maturation factor RimP [Candidatus Agathobaculum merdipullorum]
MQAKQIVARVEELVRPLCEQAGVSLWDVEFEKEGGQYMLTVTVDHPDGVNIDQCEQVSRALDPMLDEKEFDSMPSYTLCVSSAGLSRRLKKPEHFAAFLGHTVEVGFYKPVGGAKQVEGTLVAYENGNVTLETGGQRTVYEPADIAAVRLAVEI